MSVPLTNVGFSSVCKMSNVRTGAYTQLDEGNCHGDEIENDFKTNPISSEFIAGTVDVVSDVDNSDDVNFRSASNNIQTADNNEVHSEIQTTNTVSSSDMPLCSEVPPAEIPVSEQQSSLQQTHLWNMNYHEAAIFLEEGDNNVKFTFHPQTQEDLPAYLLVHNQWFYCIDFFASFVLLLLALVERPAVNLFRLPIGIHGSIELLALLTIALEQLLKIRWQGWRATFTHKRTTIKTAALIIMFAEAIVVLVRQSSHFRVTRALRPIFIIDSQYCGGVRRFIRQALQSLPPILDMMGLILFFMLIYSILGFFLFSSNPKDPYFSSIQNSFVSLFVLITTANFPDVMMPAYAYSRWAAAFFITYLVICLYFLMNLMLAVVYETFTQIEKEKFRKLLLHKWQASQFAFRLLVSRSSPHHVTYRHFLGMMKYFVPEKKNRDIYLVFKSLNLSRSGSLSVEEFVKIYEALTLTWRPKHQVEESCECGGLIRNIRRLVTWKMFDYFICFIILLNGVVLLIRTIHISSDPSISSTDLKATWDSIAFVGFYTIEAILKILGLGLRKYFSSGWNIYDFTVTMLAVVGIIAEYFDSSFFYVVILRPLRLLRLFKLKKRYRDVFGTLFILLPQMASAAAVLLIIYYFFAVVGMELFSGYDMKNCCVNTTVEQFYKYDNTTFYQGYYYLNNFSNLLKSSVTLFELTVVNNWFIIMDGFASVSSDWSRIYFMIFYLVTMVIITIIVASIFDAFIFRIQYKKKMGQEEEAQSLSIIVELTKDDLQICYGRTRNIRELQDYARDLEENGTIAYIGSRKRTKDVLQLKMYEEEIQEWLAAAQHEGQHNQEEMWEQLRIQRSRNISLGDEAYEGTNNGPQLL